MGPPILPQGPQAPHNGLRVPEPVGPGPLKQLQGYLGDSGGNKRGFRGKIRVNHWENKQDIGGNRGERGWGITKDEGKEGDSEGK